MKTPWVDKTGLIGKYDAEFMFAAPSRSPDADPPGGPGVVQVFEKELGLRLKKKGIAIDVIVVDSADKIPTEN